jgi:hypothetical protein
MPTPKAPPDAAKDYQGSQASSRGVRMESVIATSFEDSACAVAAVAETAQARAA